MKWLVRFFLVLSVVLFSGYNFLLADGYEYGDCFGHVRMLETQAQTAYGISEDIEPTSTISAATFSDADNDEFDSTNDEDEDEDDEITALKKYPDAGHSLFLTNITHTRIPGTCCSVTKKRLLSYKSFSYTSSQRFIVFRSIRI